MTRPSSSRSTKSGEERGRSRRVGTRCGGSQRQPRPSRGRGRKMTCGLIHEAAQAYQTNTQPQIHQLIFGWEADLNHQAAQENLDILRNGWN